jgi:hypothetical protein
LEEGEKTADRGGMMVEAGEALAARQDFECSLVARRDLGSWERALQSREQLEVERLGEMLQEWADGC